MRQEDVDTLEAVEQIADLHASTRRETSTKVDEGALKVRRILRKILEKKEGRSVDKSDKVASEKKA